MKVAKAIGATVIAAASSADKLALCKKLGADHVVNYATEDLKQRTVISTYGWEGDELVSGLTLPALGVQEITDGKFVDVVYEVVGGNIFKEVPFIYYLSSIFL